MNPFLIFYYHLYLLQLEEYDVARYLRAIMKLGIFPRQKLRKPLVWTLKAILLAIISSVSQLGLFMTLSYATYSRVNTPVFAVLIFLLLTFSLLYISFLFHTWAIVITIPLDLVTKQLYIVLAKNKIKNLKHLKIIGIAGSYGKTTMKEMLATVLKQTYNVLSTPKSYNTPLAIAQIILHDLTLETDIFIVEMGEYYQGDIRDICTIAPPDIGIITGINEAHGERLKTIDTTIATIFELSQNTKKQGIVALNIDDSNIKNNYKRYVNGKKIILYQTLPTPDAPIAFNDVVFHQDASGYSFKLLLSNKSYSCHISLLGEYIFGNLSAIIQIVQKLEISDEQIVKGIRAIKPVPHRLQPILELQKRILVIDDSYNGNPDGVEEAIKILAKFTSWHKIYLSPGLVEMGDKTAQIHYTIGIKLGKVADIVILIRNSVTPYIEKGLLKSGFPEKNIRWYETAQAAHEDLKNVVKSGNVVLFQNDWADNYY